MSVKKPKASVEVSKFQKFEPQTIHRSLLKGASYNPRVIDDKAKAKLRAGLESKGLVEPIVWNSRTGNIVGGHQRIGQLDVLEGNSDYNLTVAVVDVDSSVEKELNVLLNNPSTQGDWDFEKLKELFEDDEVSVEGTGFDMAEVYQLFGNDPTAAPSKVLGELNKQLEEAKDLISKMDREAADTDDEDYYSVIVFKNHAQRKNFTDSLGLEDNCYIDGSWLDNYVFEDNEDVRKDGPKKENKEATAE